MIRLALFAGVLIASTPVRADVGSPDSVGGISSTSSAVNPSSSLAPISIVEGPGIRVGEGTVIHPIVGLETGYISNAFYEDTNPVGAGIMRLVVQLATSSLGEDRLKPSDPDAEGQTSVGSMEYRAALRASYDFYLSGNDNLQAQGGLGLGALLRGTVFPRQTWSFLYLENFERVIRSTNFESTARTNRDVNRLQLGIQFAPQGRSLSGILHFEDVIDVFEDDQQQFANRLQNTLGLTVNWRFQPMTVFFGDASIGMYQGLGSESVKNDSFPLTVAAGVQTLLTLKTSVVARIGYTNGFYSTGPSYSSVLGGLQVGYRYAPGGRVTAMYEYLHQDSINANFYRDHALKLSVDQEVYPFLLTGMTELRLREYQGVTSVVPGPDVRDDLIFAVTGGIRYNFRKTLGAVAEYRFSTVQTDYMSAAGDDPSFARHEVVVGVRAAL